MLPGKKQRQSKLRKNSQDEWVCKGGSIAVEIGGIEEGERMLVKGGHGVFHQQPYNEAVASNILKRLSCHIQWRRLKGGLCRKVLGAAPIFDNGNSLTMLREHSR